MLSNRAGAKGRLMNDFSEKVAQIGNKFAEFLHGLNVGLEENNDGRLESLNSEDAVTDALRAAFDSEVKFLDKNHNRSFGDITIVVDDINVAINIKMVSEKTAVYNGGSAKHFNWVLYGKGDTSWGKLAKSIAENPPTNICQEYYYLVYYKRSKKKPQFVSLTDISRESIATNPSNPIQLKQKLSVVKRSEEEKVCFMLELFGEVLRKRAEPYLILKGIRQHERL